jgi:putative aldouronate transport system permease protein
MKYQVGESQRDERMLASNHESIAQRVWRYKLHYIIVIPAMLLLVLFKIIPFASGIWMSLVDYKVFVGLFNSSWVGFDHFTRLFEDSIFRRVLVNTILIKGMYILISGAAAFLIALALGSIRSKLIRGFFSSLFLIPFFIPSAVFAYIFLFMFSPSVSPFLTTETLIWANADLFRPMLVFIEVLKTCGIPIVIALAAISVKHAAIERVGGESASSKMSYTQMNVFPALRAIVAFMILQLSTILSTDLELMKSLVNPLVMESGDTIDHYSFQVGFFMMEVSRSAAIGLVQFGIQLFCTIVAYIIVRGSFLKDLFNGYSNSAAVKAESVGKNLIGVIIAVLYAIVIVFPLYLLFVFPFTGGAEQSESIWSLISLRNVISYVVIDLIAVVIRLPGRTGYKLLLILIITMGGGLISEYMFVHNLGMIGTRFPQLFYGFFNLTAVFVLKSIFNSKYADLKEQAEAGGRGELHTFFTLFIPKIWKPLLALGALHYVAIWNSYIPSLVYIPNVESYSPIMQFMQLASSGEQNIRLVLKFGAWLSLPSIAIFLVFRKWFTSEVFVSTIRKL